MHDLLRDPLISVRARDGSRRVSLPALIAGYLSGDIEECTGLRAHQADPWHVFLVQVAASVLARLALNEPPTDETFWREGLAELAGGRQSAWELVVDDPTQPAFLQHPLVSAAALKEFKLKAETPDELDVLVTAKDHDVKMARIRADSAEQWLYSLVAFQTTSGYLGSGNFGSIRMNGGFASRCVVSLVSDPRPAPRFAEELRELQRMRAATLACGIGYAAQGVVLTWLEPWDRNDAQYTLAELEPWFVEAVRPVRLRSSERGLHALGSTSKARQIGPKTLDGGDVADPWLPINVEDKKKGRSALTVPAAGWTPERLTDLLFQRGYELTALQRVRRSASNSMYFVGSVLVRGQGTTEGFHRFSLPVPGTVIPRLLDDDTRDALGRLARELLADAREAEYALRDALKVLSRGGFASGDSRAREDDTTQRWALAAASGFAREWSGRYFEQLWKSVDRPSAELRGEWREVLVALAREQLRAAEMRLPRPAGRRYRAIVDANDALQGRLKRKGLIPDSVMTERHEVA